MLYYAFNLDIRNYNDNLSTDFLHDRRMVGA